MSPYLLSAKPDHSSQCILAFTSISFGMQRQPVCPRVARSVAFAHIVQFFLLIAVANDSLFTFYLVALHIQILVHAQVHSSFATAASSPSAILFALTMK